MKYNIGAAIIFSVLALTTSLLGGGKQIVSAQSSSSSTAGCIDVERYYTIHEDIDFIAANIDTDEERSHFFGGIVRLAAHDFMDYDQDDEDPMGMDGCLDWLSPMNAGLNSIWNFYTPLYRLYEEKYSDISRPDFWVIAANAVILLTSVDNALDLQNTFYWGRRERDECDGSASRLPSTQNCQQVEGVFLDRMGMKWKDAVALLGAHVLGRGSREVSLSHESVIIISMNKMKNSQNLSSFHRCSLDSGAVLGTSWHLGSHQQGCTNIQQTIFPRISRTLLVSTTSVCRPTSSRFYHG